MHHLSMTNSIPQRFTAGVPCFTLLFITTAWLVHCSPRASAAGETAASIQAELSSSASFEKHQLSKDVVPRPSDRQRHDPRRRALAVLRAALDRARADRPHEHVTTGPDLFYSFYQLPDCWVGGGPELLLRFHGGRCVSAHWRFTQ